MASGNTGRPLLHQKPLNSGLQVSSCLKMDRLAGIHLDRFAGPKGYRVPSKPIEATTNSRMPSLTVNASCCYALGRRYNVLR